jgi:hypothetical protein
LFHPPPLLERQIVHDGLIPPILEKGWQLPLKEQGKVLSHLTQEPRKSGLGVLVIKKACHMPFLSQDLMEDGASAVPSSRVNPSSSSRAFRRINAAHSMQ